MYYVGGIQSLLMLLHVIASILLKVNCGVKAQWEPSFQRKFNNVST